MWSTKDIIDSSLFLIETFVGCHSENDTNWGIRWPIAMKGETVTQSCPGGTESVGKHFLT